MPDVRLTLMTRAQGNNRALLDGTIRPDGFELAPVDVPVLIDGFRRMVRGLEFDVAEMAATTYLCARAHGVPFTALPVLVVRDFHHDAIRVDTRTVAHAADLEGRRVGVNRGYTVTTGVWARAILAEAGVDLGEVTWVRSGDEHVAAYRPPPNVVSLPAGDTLEQQLARGELAATIGVSVQGPDLAPLFPPDTGVTALRERGFYPVNHLIVVRDEVLERHPDAAEALFRAFSTAKDRYVDALRTGRVEQPDATDERYRTVLAVTGEDPLPYGVEANRPVLEALVKHAVSQGILDRPIPLEHLFARSTLAV